MRRVQRSLSVALLCAALAFAASAEARHGEYAEVDCASAPAAQTRAAARAATSPSVRDSSAAPAAASSLGVPRRALAMAAPRVRRLYLAKLALLL